MVKNLPASAGDVGLILGSGRSPGGGNGNPLQYSWLENYVDRGAWWTMVHGGHKELDMTEGLNSNHSYCSHSDILLLFVTLRTDFLRYVMYWILCCFDKLLVLESFCIAVHSWYCTFLGLDKRVMTCVHHYCIMQNCQTALKIPVFHPVIFPSVADLCNVSIVLPFLECYVLGFIEENMTLLKAWFSWFYSGKYFEGLLP